MNTSIGNTLAELRKAKKFMQKDVALKMANYGYKVRTNTIYNWEKEHSQPSIQQFLALCDIYGVDDILWRFTGKHTGILAGLNQEGRDKAKQQVELLYQIDKFRDDHMEVNEPQRMYRLYDIPVSAGTGNFLDDSGFKMIKAPEYVPENADFALRVSGDSMFPQINDGQVIWIKEQETLNHGEIGIFVYSGDVYCKELYTDGNGAYLRSLNPEYEDIEIKEDFGFKTVGKVIS